MNSIKIRTKRIDGNTQIRTLISHPMETGLRVDKDSGATIPANYIQELTVQLNEQVVASSIMGAGVSKNPYFAFLLKGGAAGDKITISWQDNLGNRDSQETFIK